MKHAVASDIVAEQIRYWRNRGWTAEMAWRAFHPQSAEHNNAAWADVRAFMLRWLAAAEIDRAA